MIQIHERTLNFHERELRGSDVSQGFWGDFHWGMIQIHERALNFHERELRGSDVSARILGRLSFREDYNPRKGTKLSLKGSQRIWRIARILGETFIQVEYRSTKGHWTFTTGNSADMTYRTDIFWRYSFGDDTDPRKDTKLSRKGTKLSRKGTKFTRKIFCRIRKN